MSDIIELEPKSGILMTTARLEAALAAAKPGSTVYAATGVFTIKKTMVVPEGVTLEGIGTMRFDAIGRPQGLGGPITKLRADPALKGDILTLANGAQVRSLFVEDVTGRQGNLIVISSTKPGDEVAAMIDECELLNPNPSGIGADGPVGRGVVVLTRNPGRALPPPPDEAARVTAVMRRSVIRSPGGGSGVFAMNFAPRARVIVRLGRNVIGGGLDAAGGVSRPDAVSYSETLIYSETNLYRAGVAAAGIGWSFYGGVNAPNPALIAPYTDTNVLVMDSANDVIEGFAIGLYAAGGSRPYSTSGPVNRNRAYLTLDATRFVKSSTADVMLFGAQSDVYPPSAGAGFAPGDDNHLYVTLRGVKASAGGGLTNVYEDSAKAAGGLLPLALRGAGNSLEILGEIPFKPGPPAKIYLDKPLKSPF